MAPLDNHWADPAGVGEDNTPIVYTILDPVSGAVVKRLTSVTFDAYTQSRHHAMATDDQHYANTAASIIQQACTYFYAKDEDYVPMEGVPDIAVSDDEVRERIRRLDLGENTREALGYNARSNYSKAAKRSYPLQELPWSQQRALVEQLLKHRRDYKVEILGPAYYRDESGVITPYDYAKDWWASTIPQEPQVEPDPEDVYGMALRDYPEVY